MHALELATKSANRTPETRKFMGELMTSLETMKISAKSTDPKGAVASFAERVFAKADREDRAGKSTLTTARSFYAASNFYEVLKNFEELDSETTEKVKYAKWRATEITKAIKNNEPVPPPPSVAAREELDEITAEMNRLDAEVKEEQEKSDQASGLESSQHFGEGNEVQDNHDVVELPSMPTTSSHENPDVFQYPSAPPVSSFPSSVQSAPPPFHDAEMHSTPRTTSHPMETRYASKPKVVSPTVIHDVRDTSESNEVDEERMALAKKHAKWAISAIDFEDPASARDNLRKALEALG